MMIKKIGLLCSTLWLLTACDAAMPTAKIKYRSLFDIDGVFCAIKTNGVLSQDNRDDIAAGEPYGTGSTGSMLVMENGDNEITLEVAAFNWFKPEITDAQQKNRFQPDNYCTLKLIKLTGTQPEEISQLKVTIDAQGQPTASTSVVKPAYTAINRPITMQQRQETALQPGFIPENYYSPEYYPEGMQVYQFTRIVNVNGLPEWPWVKATPYTDTPEQRQLLQQAYQELWQAFNQKDLSKIKQLYGLSMKAWAYSTDSDEEEIFTNGNFEERVNSPDFRMLPIDWSGYEVVIMNKGRMVKLINKSEFGYSPILFIREKKIFTYNPIFSLINGRFVIVI
ncbi:hypothetical protein [Serratia microhaemolytica]|uniref:hypothetical protein n=1 Tax=Serratia microhaemolytica TaxID=2675110 RepID=UPI000FDDDE30|nr:hypothetical protein [Serratia microhaemolytica]